MVLVTRRNCFELSKKKKSGEKPSNLYVNRQAERCGVSLDSFNFRN